MRTFAAMFHRFFLFLWTVLVLLAVPSCKQNGGGTASKPDSASGQTSDSAQQPGESSGTRKDFPDYVLRTLEHVKKHGEAPEGQVGGRVFQNREKNLPQKDASGQKIQYREWDVHPKIPGKNRGAERLVTGSDHSAWYTKNHYKSFEKIE